MRKSTDFTKIFLRKCSSISYNCCRQFAWVAVNRSTFSFPVGKVDIKTMYPMDIEEFMIAMGNKDLTEMIRKSFESNAPMPAALHDICMQLYRQYLVVGGMPECVSLLHKQKIMCLFDIIKTQFLQVILMI